MVTKDAFFAGPGNDRTVETYLDVPDSKPLSIAGRAVAVGNGRLWTADGIRVACFDLRAHLANEDNALQWESSSDAEQSLIVSGDAERMLAIAAGANRIVVFDAMSGNSLQTLTIPDSDDQIQYIAVAGGDPCAD